MRHIPTIAYFYCYLGGASGCELPRRPLLGSPVNSSLADALGCAGCHYSPCYVPSGEVRGQIGAADAKAILGCRPDQRSFGCGPRASPHLPVARPTRRRLGNPNITAEELAANGTVTSLPLYPWIALIVFALLARSRRWWGAIGVVVLCLLGALFIFGGLGEAFAPSTPYVPRAVLVAAGVVYGGLGLALLLSGSADLIDRARPRRRPSRVS